MAYDRPLRLGTRGSQLALKQAEIAVLALAAVGQVCEIVTVRTTGDKVQDRPLAEIGGKALFAKEIEEALLRDEIDFAVHSLKDLPVELPDGLKLAAVLPRETPLDVMVLPRGGHRNDLPACFRLGTGSVRRVAQSRRAWPEVKILSIRGNVDTRLAKLDRGDFDAVILAAAGLHRLGRAGRISSLLDRSQNWLPALAQGAIGIETRMDDVRTNAIVEPLNDQRSAVCVACERGFQQGLGGSCHSPMAGLAEILDNRLVRFHGEVIAPDGSDFKVADFELVLDLKDMYATADEAYRFGFSTGENLRPRVLPWLGP